MHEKHEKDTATDARRYATEGQYATTQNTLLERLEWEQRELIIQLARVQEKIFRLKQDPALREQIEFFIC